MVKLFYSGCIAALSITMTFMAVDVRACRIYGSIGTGLTDGLLEEHLVSAPYSLSELSRKYHVDGWGIAYYDSFGADVTIARGAVRAWEDSVYGDTIDRMGAAQPAAVLAHIRWCTSGCCAHNEDVISDPHPFLRTLNGTTWTFVHNGSVSKARMVDLIGEEYLNEHAPFGSGLETCLVDNATSPLVVDSELYFLYLLKAVEANAGDATGAIVEAIETIISDGEDQTLNFILSDGTRVWAFRRTAWASYEIPANIYATLYYRYDAAAAFTAVASQYPVAEQEEWVLVNNYVLLVLSSNVEPEVIHIPGCGDGIVDSGETCDGDNGTLCEDLHGAGWQCGSGCLCEYVPVPGDVDADGDVDLRDITELVRAVLGGNDLEGNGDCNGDGTVALNDALCIMRGRWQNR
ncbi:MAG: hypothetical protein GY868_13335 [Deltaproteobacteria bacterium]|nr:hypothetical protein [Deltaproteobacteria bacterium]